MGGSSKFSEAGTESASNFNLATSNDMISKIMNVSSAGDYYFYIVAKSDTEITKIHGNIDFKDN